MSFLYVCPLCRLLLRNPKSGSKRLQRDCEPAPISPPPAFKLANRASRVCPACTAGLSIL